MLDFKMFGANIYTLIGLPILAAVVLIIILAARTSINIGVWRVRRKRAEAELGRGKLRPDRQPRPATARGLCDRCARALENVYCLPTGQRVRANCYQEPARTHQPRPSANQGP